MPPDRPQVTMRDVAARAGVTPTVVSRVLHNKATAIRVSEATAERVRVAAKEMGYRPNVMARNFRERQTMMIGVLHGIHFATPTFSKGSRYFAALMDGIVEGAFQHGYSVTLCPKLLGQSPEDAMSDGRFDALIWYSTFPMADNWQMLQNCSVPLTLIHTPAATFGGKFSSVMCDNLQGIRLAVDHLYELGHRRIAFALEGEDSFGESLMRREAFIQVAKERGTRPELIEMNLDRSGIPAYFDQGLRHTAIIAHHDELAADIIAEATHRGIRIPEDLSIVGFDSTSYCEQLRPALTSVAQPLVEIGKTAVELLVASIAGDPAGTKEIKIPCHLDLRSSTTHPLDPDHGSP